MIEHKSLRKAFLEPNREYSPLPFWFLNDELDEEEIRRQIGDFQDHGVEGFVLHPRIGLPERIGYLSDSYMSYIRCAVEEAHQRGMKVVLYDEGMYPSGSACGQVVEGHPEYASQGLMKVTVKTDEINRGLEVDEEKPYGFEGKEVARRKVENQGRSEEIVFYQVATGGNIRGIHFGQDDGEENTPASADLLNPKAVERFIELTHERYKSAVGDFFGTTVIGFFTDEPAIMGRNPRKGVIPWTDGLLDLFLMEHRLEDLPTLFETEENSVKLNFERLLHRLLGESFYGPLSAWCEKNGLWLMGHPEKSDESYPLKHFHVPGQDLVWRWVAPEEKLGRVGQHSTMAKCSADYARHTGRRRNSNECFGCCGSNGLGWTFTADDMKWYLDWLFIRGVNMLFPHAFYYSLAGERRYGERPPDVGPNNIWWPYYKQFSDYMKRMSWMMSDSVNQTPIAILASGYSLPWKIGKPLYEKQIEFNYLSDDLFLLSSTRIEQGCIFIQKQCYTSILIEDLQTLPKEAVDKLQEFVRQGGKVYEEEQVHRFIPEAKAALGYTLDREDQEIRVSHLVKEGKEFLVVSNEGNESCKNRLILTREGLKNVQLWNPWDHSMKSCSFNQVEGKISLPFQIERRELLIFALDLEAGEDLDLEALEDLEVYGDDEGKVVASTEIIEEVMQVDWQVDLFVKKNCRYELAIEEAHEIAVLSVNGKELGAQMWAPYRFDLTQELYSLMDTESIDTESGEKVVRVKISVKAIASVAERYEAIRVPKGIKGVIKLTEVLRRENHHESIF